MDETFLKEQLHRIHRLAERLSQVQNRLAEASYELSHRHPTVETGPLNRVRDYRTYQTYHYELDGEGELKSHRERSRAHHSSGRRRRR